MSSKPKHLSQVYLRARRGPVVVGDVLYRPGGSFGPRTQMDFQLVVIHRGSLRLKLNEEVIEVPENHAILLKPGKQEHFFFAPERETRHSWVAVAPRAVMPEVRRELEQAQGAIPFLGKMASLLEMLRTPSNAREKFKALSSGLTQGLALALLCEFASAACGGPDVQSANDAVLSRFDTYLAGSYGKPISLEEMAKGAHVSRQHLLKICRMSGRPTPVQQLYRKRLEAAADLLLHTGLPLSQVSDQCGFANPFHFSRKYKQFWGESPLSWRQRHWRDSQAR
jgi:AraC-like DNA-binding protein